MFVPLSEGLPLSGENFNDNFVERFHNHSAYKRDFSKRLPLIWYHSSQFIEKFVSFSFASHPQVVYHESAKQPPAVNASVEDLGEGVVFQFLVRPLVN